MNGIVVVLNAARRCDRFLLHTLTEVIGIVTARIFETVVPTSSYAVVTKAAERK